MYSLPDHIVAFAGTDLIADGAPAVVATAIKALADADDSRTLLLFDAETSGPVEIDLRGTLEDVLRRAEESSAVAEASGTLAPEIRRGPGRPKLGVVAREVTLLPRHWEWLATQPGGASATLRRLVETARKSGGSADRRRAAQDATYRFTNAIAGNEVGFEEATRALYAGDRSAFEAHTAAWAPDVRDHARRLADAAF